MPAYMTTQRAPTCPLGHRLMLSNHSSNEYKSGFNCEQCGKTFVASTERWFCLLCGYDMCISCTNITVTVTTTVGPRVGDVKKPVLYVYAAINMTLQISLDATEGLFNLYPRPATATANHCVWDNVNALAMPHGGFYSSILEYNGVQYPYLHWDTGCVATLDDGKTVARVSRGNIATYLAKFLAAAGLNARESTDFITYWIHSMGAYASVDIALAPAGGCLSISPEMPILRVWVVWRGYHNVDALTDIWSFPTAPHPRPQGPHAVEWGAYEAL